MKPCTGAATILPPGLHTLRPGLPGRPEIPRTTIVRGVLSTGREAFPPFVVEPGQPIELVLEAAALLLAESERSERAGRPAPDATKTTKRAAAIATTRHPRLQPGYAPYGGRVSRVVRDDQTRALPQSPRD